jgi:demethylmenaquinone methyltransferase/2-methoxy-6-polyprenyl-1,4-benzoquinol methylase
MPVVGGWISGDRAAYDYLPASVDKFPSPERFVEMMREAGLQECRAKRLTFGVAYIYIGVKR